MFLASAFSVDALRRMVRQRPLLTPVLNDVCWERSPADAMGRFVEGMEQHGLVGNQFFVLLEHERPHRKSEIERLRDAYGVPVVELAEDETALQPTCGPIKQFGQPTGDALVTNTPSIQLPQEQLPAGQSFVEYASASIPDLQKLAQAGDSSAQFFLGKKLRVGEGVAKNDVQAFRSIRSAAEAGHAEAQFTVGVMCMRGEGTFKSESECRKWYRIAAENGWPEAQYLEYICLWYGDDESSRTVALGWLQKAAANRYAAAASDLAGLYAGIEEFDFIQPNDEMAVYWQRIAMEEYFTEATEGNDARAQYALGLAYDSKNTPGVENDPKEAVKWFRLAADQRHPRALHQLGWCYRRGRGVEKKDVRQAITLFTAAAEMGNADSENAIGMIYQDGDEVTRSLAKAAKWYRLAASHGCYAASYNLKNIGYGE